jgi:hypothetical protein
MGSASPIVDAVRSDRVVRRRCGPPTKCRSRARVDNDDEQEREPKEKLPAMTLGQFPGSAQARPLPEPLHNACDHNRLPFITPNSYRLAVAAMWLNVRCSLARTDHRPRRRRRVGNLGVTRLGEVVFGTAHGGRV